MESESAVRIIVRSPNWVGDAVMALPFFASLRRNAPGANIACLTQGHLAPLYRDASGVDEVLVLDNGAGRRGWRHVWRNARRLRGVRLDLGFCLPPSFGSAAILWFGGVRRRVGHSVDGRGVLLSDKIPYGRNGSRPHRTEGYLNLLRLVWPDPVLERTLHFAPSQPVRDAVDAWWPSLSLPAGHPILAIAPGAAGLNKRWAAKRFAMTARRWIDQFGGGVILVGAASEHEMCAEVMRGTGGENIHNLAGRGDLAECAEIIRRADVFVGNDSGLAHLAAAVGTHTVVISGPGDPAEVAPYSPLAVTVKRAVFCSPCYRNTCWRRDLPLECLDLVTVDEVWDRVRVQVPSSS